MRAAQHQPRHSSGRARPVSDARRQRWTPASWQWGLTGLLVAGLWGLVLSNFTSLFGAGSWWLHTVLVSSVTVLTSVLVQIRFAPRGPAAALLGACSGAVCGGWIVYRSDRMSYWRHELPLMVEHARERLNSGPAPIDPAGPLADVLLLIVVLLSATTALLLVGLRSPLAAGVTVSVLLLIPTAVTGSSVSVEMLVAAGLLLGMLAWAGSAAPTPTGLTVVGVAIVVTVGVMSLAPATRDRVFDDAVLHAPVSGATPDVTVTLAEDLRERSNARAFSFTATHPGAYRFTLATLTEFSGGRWLPDDELTAESLTVDQPRSATAVPPVRETWPRGAEQAETEARVTVRVRSLRSPWLPLPQSSDGVIGAASEGGFDPQQWRWTLRANTAYSDDAVTQRGQEYTADAGQLLGGPGMLGRDSTEPESARQLILDDSETPEDMAEYLELPQELPQPLEDLAAEITRDAEDRVAVGLALEQYFRRGEFSYDESAPYQPGADPGDPYAVMVGLLDQRRGFCVHYASTFAVLAREAGAPARVALGYASRAEEEEATAVRNGDLHAWPEIFVDELGWIAFEPTPGGAGVQADSGNAALPVHEQDADEEASPGSSVPVDETRPELTEPGVTENFAEQIPGDQSPSVDDEHDQSSMPAEDQGVSQWLWLAPLVLVVLLAPAGWRALRRLWRYRRISRGHRPGEHAWAEVLNSAAELKLLGPDAQTPAPRAQTTAAIVEHLESRGALTFTDAEAARAIADAAEAERYSLSAPTATPAELREHLDQVRQGLSSGATRGARLRARFF